MRAREARVGREQTIPTAAWTSAHTVQHRPKSGGVPYNRGDGCFVDRAQYLMAVTHYSGATVTTCHAEQCPRIVTLSRQPGPELHGNQVDRDSKFYRKKKTHNKKEKKLAKTMDRRSNRRGGDAKNL